VITSLQAFEAVKQALEGAGITYQLAELTMYPQSTIELDEKNADQMLRMMEQLEDLDDIQHVYANFDIPESVMEQLGQ